MIVRRLSLYQIVSTVLGILGYGVGSVSKLIGVPNIASSVLGTLAWGWISFGAQWCSKFGAFWGMGLDQFLGSLVHYGVGSVSGLIGVQYLGPQDS
jgi:hypothetical protein